ncbi:type III secretion protein [Paraburkholderia sp. Tr-20389]|uniref:type III secretion protein n=1 Tax=Paraburkholderia sp. Tr-20389 TaxID=2703903 RepID=UPI0019804B72|nr:type III secretion protein [Paraburkholderia sp. Tr-20389]MBN3751838.1 type III secretion protein [Paraburkholderia sp. Tr-20389]
MYETIERHAQHFMELQNVVTGANADTRVAELRKALEESAEQLNHAADGTPADRDARARIYRGLVAASRIVGQLREDAMRG